MKTNNVRGRFRQLSSLLVLFVITLLYQNCSGKFESSEVGSNFHDSGEQSSLFAKLTWIPNAPQEAVTGYSVHYGEVSGSYVYSKIINLSELVVAANGRVSYSFRDAEFTEGKTFFFVVRANNAAGTSVNSNEAMKVF